MTLSSYFISLILVASVCAVTAALAPEGTEKKHLHLLLSVVVLLVLLSPLSRLSLSAPDLPEVDVQTPEGEHLVLRATKDALRQVLCKELSIPEDDLLLSISGACDEEGNVTLTAVTVTLYKESATKREATRAYLEKNLPTDCEVYVYVEPYQG